MISIHVNHPDVMDFAKIKSDKTKVTGANISIKLNNAFMKAVENDEDYMLRFPTTFEFPKEFFDDKFVSYNDLHADIIEGTLVYYRRIKAKEYWDEFIKQAKDNAEPGLMYWDTVLDYDPAGVYDKYRPIGSNPCFHPDTLVETEYGKLAIKDITKPMRVYSMDSDGKSIMSNASASFISKKDAQTYKVTLKNGSSISLTEDHKLYIHDKGWVEVQDIIIGDRVAHLCRSRRGAKYAGVHLTTSTNGSKDQVMEHKLVYGPHTTDFNVHHLDRNTYNDSIENLELLSHSEHSRITALEDNPQTHQVRNEKGMFISGKDSKKGKKVIVDLPEDLKTNILSRHHNSVVSIEKDIITDVYDIQVEDTHCLVANNMVAHNCGEQFLQANDSCRLIALNMSSFVNNKYTEHAEFDFKKWYEVCYEGLRLGDDLVDLEAEYIERIIQKIKKDPEHLNIKQQELNLWRNSKLMCLQGRRVGMGITGLGDILAFLNIKYDSIEAIFLVSNIMATKLKAELHATTDLGILRGTFYGWDSNVEFSKEGKKIIGNNSFYTMLSEKYKGESEKMYNIGRRNISFSTIAPTGSVSLLANNCTSGCEPLFQPYYIRRKKVNPGDNVRIDFVDQNGDSWQEFPVIHPNFEEWIKIKHGEEGELNKEKLQELFEKSPWYGSTANDVDWDKRVAMQAVLQQYTTNAISSTINLLSTVTYEEVEKIYKSAWKQGLKGVTVYVDGSRSGVLITETNKNRDEFDYIDAVKRNREEDGESHVVSIKGIKYTVIVGLKNNKPYEIFAYEGDGYKGNGKIIKKNRGNYVFVSEDKEYPITANLNDLQEAVTRGYSWGLRHGGDIKFAVEQLQKTKQGDFYSFNRALARVLKKYIPDGAKSTVQCSNCGSDDVIFEEGCNRCRSCGHSECS